MARRDRIGAFSRHLGPLLALVAPQFVRHGGALSPMSAAERLSKAGFSKFVAKMAQPWGSGRAKVNGSGINLGSPTMKKVLAASTMLGIFFAGSALAADLPVKAPIMHAPVPVYNWTGCYLGAGGGYGMWNQDFFGETDPGHSQLTSSVTAGGK